MVTIHLEDETDRWEWRCPRGHAQWEPTNFHFFCATCSRHPDADPSFDELVSAKTGERVAREDVRLVDEIGPLPERRPA